MIKRKRIMILIFITGLVFSTQMIFSKEIFLDKWENQTSTFNVVGKQSFTNLDFKKICGNVFDREIKKCTANECISILSDEKLKCENKATQKISDKMKSNEYKLADPNDTLPLPIVMPSDNEVSLGISGACISILNIKQFRIIHTCYHMDGSVDTTIYSKEATTQLFLDGKWYYDEFLSYYMSAGQYDKTPGMLDIDFLSDEYAPNCPLWPFYQCISLDAFRKYLLIFGFKSTIFIHPGQLVFERYVKGHHTLEQLRKWGAKKIRNLFSGDSCHNSVCLTDQQVKDLVEWGEITEEGTEPPPVHPGQIVFDTYVKGHHTLDQLKGWGAKKIRNLFLGSNCHNAVCLTDQQVSDLIEWGEITEDGTDVTPIHPGQIVFDTYVKGHHTLDQLKKWGAKKIRKLFAGDNCHQTVCLTDQQVKDLVDWGKISENGDDDD